MRRRRRPSSGCGSRPSTRSIGSTTRARRSTSSSSSASRPGGSTPRARSFQFPVASHQSHTGLVTDNWLGTTLLGGLQAAASAAGKPHLRASRYGGQAAAHPRRTLQSRAAALRAARVPFDRRSRGLLVHGVETGSVDTSCQLPVASCQLPVPSVPSFPLAAPRGTSCPEGRRDSSGSFRLHRRKIHLHEGSLVDHPLPSGSSGTRKIIGKKIIGLRKRRRLL
jgi:hypothetical protein